MSKRILPNEEALSLVRQSIYIDRNPDFVVCLCVGYTRDELKSLDGGYKRRAVEAFRELLAADDWEERTLQLWDARSGKVQDVQPEVMR